MACIESRKFARTCRREHKIGGNLSCDEIRETKLEIEYELCARRLARRGNQYRVVKIGVQTPWVSPLQAETSQNLHQVFGLCYLCAKYPVPIFDRNKEDTQL